MSEAARIAAVLHYDKPLSVPYIPFLFHHS